MASNPASSTIPQVVLDPKCSKTQQTRELQVLLQSASNELARINAWPPGLGVVEILIFKVGAGVGAALKAGIWTETQEDLTMQAADIVRRDPTKNIRILVDEAIFESGIAKKMVDRNESPADVALWCLAHEIFHVDEVERMAEVGIKMKNRRSSFAGAVRPEFSTPWKTAWQALSSRYPTDDDIPPDLQAAGEIANEASADLTAIHFLKLAGRDWRKFIKNLAGMREETFQSWSKDSKSIFSLPRFSSPKAPPYRISEAIGSFVANESDDLPELTNIYARCWTMALEKALALGSLDQTLRVALRAAEQSVAIEEDDRPAPPIASGCPPSTP